MGKLARSWELVKASWAVLQADKELLIFPILSTIAVITVMATFAAPMFLAGVFDSGLRMGGTIPFAGILLGFGELPTPRELTHQRTSRTPRPGTGRAREHTILRTMERGAFPEGFDK